MGALRPTLALRDLVDGREALRFYTEDSAFLYRLPKDPGPSNVHDYLLEIHLEERTTIRCDYMVEDDPSDPGDFGCGSEHVKGGAKPISPKRVLSDQVSTWPLKAAILERLEDVGERYQGSLTRYRKALEDYNKEMASPSWTTYLRGSLGMPPPPPSPPSELAFIVTLRPCAQAEDENVRAAADELLKYQQITQP